jgi:hypothetical protein
MAYFYAKGDTIFIENWENWPDYYVQNDLIYGVFSCNAGDPIYFHNVTYSPDENTGIEYVNIQIEMLIPQDTLVLGYTSTIYTEYPNGDSIWLDISGPYDGNVIYIKDSTVSIGILIYTFYLIKFCIYIGIFLYFHYLIKLDV